MSKVLLIINSVNLQNFLIGVIVLPDTTSYGHHSPVGLVQNFFVHPYTAKIRMTTVIHKFMYLNVFHIGKQLQLTFYRFRPKF